jgi:hypothetical protein
MKMNDMMQNGNWKVEANCCLVMCDKCRGKEKVRISKSGGHSKEYAERVARAFHQYQAKAVQS